MARNKDYKGDGLIFSKAVADKPFTVSEVMSLLNISRGTLYNYYEKEVMDDDLKDQISKIFNTTKEELFGIKSKTDVVKKRIPLLGEGLAGTDMELNTDSQYVEQYIDVGDLLKDSEAAFTVYGNSMNPNYPSGAVLGIKRNYDGFIQPGEIYLLETKSNRVFKRLYYSEDKTAYICYSDNDMIRDEGAMKGKYYYPPFEVKFADVRRLFDVTGMIKRTRNSGIVLRQK